MATQSFAIGDSLKVLNATTVSYNGTLYHDVTSITLGDGTVTTPTQLLEDAGGVFYSENELKKCVKVEGYDSYANNKQVFTVYSKNSRQSAKDAVGSVPGGMWCEMFHFKGTANDNYILKMWSDNGLSTYLTSWLGFRLIYGTLATRAYVYTQVNDLEEESRPSPAVTVDVTYLHYVKLSGVFRPLPPFGGHYYVPMRRFRFYRTVSTSDGNFIWRRTPAVAVSAPLGNDPAISPSYGEFPHCIYVAAPGNYTTQRKWEVGDAARDEDLLDIELPSMDWDFPPVFECRGLTEGWNGMLFAHWDNMLIPFEPYRPYTAPQKYRIALPHKIHATVREGNSLLVLTSGPTYVVMGSHPSQLQFEPLQHTQASLPAATLAWGQDATRAVVKTPQGMCYATEEGLVLVSGVQSSMLTDRLYDKIAWQSKYGNLFPSLNLAYSNEKIVVFPTNDAMGNSQVISTEGGWLSQLGSFAARSAFAMAGSDGLYVVLSTNPSTLVKLESARRTRKTWKWRSKKFVLPNCAVFGCYQLIGVGSVKFTLLINDYLTVHQETVTLTAEDRQVRRLPHGIRGFTWRIELEGLSEDAVVKECYVAGTPLELKGA